MRRFPATRGPGGRSADVHQSERRPERGVRHFQESLGNDVLHVCSTVAQLASGRLCSTKGSSWHCWVRNTRIVLRGFNIVLGESGPSLGPSGECTCISTRTEPWDYSKSTLVLYLFGGRVLLLERTDGELL